MADYSGEQFSLPTVVGNSNYWAGRWEFSLTKINSNTYSYSAKCYLQLTDSSKKARNTRGADDPYCAYLTLRIPELNIEQTSRGPYGPLIGGTGWQQYRDTLSGTFTVSSQIEIHPGFEVYTGYGSSMGTTLYAVDTWWPSLGTYTVSGVTKAVPSNPRCTGKTSSSISMAFDVDWGGEGTTFDPACTLLNASGNEIKVIRNGTTSGTFTGLTRYTKYYIRGYASNSAGGGYTSNVEVWTDPENPTINKPTVSNIGRLTATVTPGVVTDDGGKTITEVETYIKGGAFGNTLHSIGKGTSAKNVSGLEPNTMYQVITRATNGITESYSAYESFTTIGNPPTITDLYAKDVTTTNATIVYTATYDHNASFNKFVVQWRYPGSSTWTTLSTSNNKIINVDFTTKPDNLIEYRITVTDNWNRSTTSPSMYYRISSDYSNEITNFKYTHNSDDTYTITGNWTTKLYNKIDICLIQGWQTQKYYEICGDITNMSMNSSGFSFKTKPYKNKHLPISFMLYIKTKFGNDIIKYLNVKEQPYTNAINIISKKSGNLSAPMSTIVKDRNNLTELKVLRQHDIIKLSRKIRYIDIDSRGTSSSISISHSGKLVLGRFTITYTYNFTHVSRTLYEFKFNSMKIRTNDNSTIRIRNNNLTINLKTDSNTKINFNCRFILPNMTVTSTDKDIDTSLYTTYILQPDIINTPITGNIIGNWNSEFDYKNNVSNSDNYSIVKNYGNSDIMNNHLVNIKVYDDTGVDRALGKTLKLTDGSNVLTYNSGNPTNNTIDSNKFIYSINGLPMRLDLGNEYKISKIEIQRRILGNNNDYIRNYIIGRNKNKELCYIFYDSQVNNQYIESHKTFVVN